MLPDDSIDPPQFSSGETEVVGQGHRIKPELGRKLVAVHMHVRGFAHIVTHEVYSVWADSGNRRHTASLGNSLRPPGSRSRITPSSGNSGHSAALVKHRDLRATIPLSKLTGMSDENHAQAENHASKSIWDNDLPPGDSPPLPRWPLTASIVAYSCWALFLVAMLVVRLTTA